MKCVKCDGALREVAVENVEVDQCDKCRGIWFDLGELEKVLAQGEIQKLRDTIDNSKTEDIQQASCPVCGGNGKMVQCASLRKRGVHIDTCSVCYGQWLDGGELEKLKKKGMFETLSGLFKRLL